jgi:transcription elongation factor S-II
MSYSFFSWTATNQILEKANAIEEAVYREFKTELGQPYKNKMRSLALNLKEKSNPGLREGVVSGTLPVARFCNMTANVSFFTGFRSPL